ncbi:U-box domain-containing protein 15 [Amaranthus tricolor]|uniref:U-box domain-containing protein 15 n=1 Tax=Amaranthus tricolor TaxID=29722 RepID=UPI002590EFE7|nr:U-box domain-containing protein 15 [Amaranthus tricolor]
MLSKKSKSIQNLSLNSPIPNGIGDLKNNGNQEEIILVEEDNFMIITPKEGRDIIHDLEVLIESIGLIGDYRTNQKKESQNLVRRIKLLHLLIQEIKETNAPLLDSTHLCLCNLRKALLHAKKLLKTCAMGSKIYLALEREAITRMFNSVNAKLSQAVDDIPFDDLNISDEVKEQTELMGLQLKRAKRRTDTQDMELAMDMMIVFSKEDGRNADIAIMERLATKLDLGTPEELREETKAVRRLSKDKRAEEHMQLILDLLNKFKQIAGIDETNAMINDDSATNKPIKPQTIKSPNIETPQEFLCPITLEIMTDPVIVSTGQTYERESIQKWLESNHRTCPKTGQVLEHLSIAPNYALKNLIMQWCEKNKVEVMRRKDDSTATATATASSAEHKSNVMTLIENLSSFCVEAQREAVHKLRLLSKESPENRILIAESRGIPPLIELLKSKDSKIKEHSVTTLLNLSIDVTNKKVITQNGAIPTIIQVLLNGNVGAKENAAATLFSLSMLDENKVIIGLYDGIPPLVNLLEKGTVRGKRDAATALFNLCLNSMNKSRAIEAGIVTPLLGLIDDSELGMIDEALSILLLIASHPQGRQEIGQLTFIQSLIEFIGGDDHDVTPKNKEGAVALLLELGLNGGSSFLLAALQFGVYEYLVDISQSGTNRAQRKACSILQLMRQYEQIP